MVRERFSAVFAVLFLAACAGPDVAPEDDDTLASSADFGDHEGGDLADDEVGTLSSGLITPPVLINEISNGRSGFVELFNPGTTAVDLFKDPSTCWWVDDRDGGGSPKLLTDTNVNHAAGSTSCAGRPAACARIGPKEKVWVTLSTLNTTGGDGVRILSSAFTGGKCSSVTAATTEGATMWSSGAGTCYARIPDGAAWSNQNVVCSPGASNPTGATTCTNGLTPGAPCFADACLQGQVVSSACACTGGTAKVCGSPSECQVGVCLAGAGCSFDQVTNGTTCGNGSGTCQFGACQASAPTVVINEFTPGSSGWVEVFNTGTAPVDISGWIVVDNSVSGSTIKKFPAGTVVPAKGYASLNYPSINTSSADSVHLKTAAGAMVEYTTNYFSSGSNAGKCFGRQPDGGAWTAVPLPSCTRGLKNAAAPGPGPTTCSGGTYGGVAFTKTEECKAVDFLNHARFSQLSALGLGERRNVYDCGPNTSCARARTWKSLGQLALSQPVNACAFGNWAALKTISAAWTDDGAHSDTVASVWANRSSLQGVEVTLEDVVVDSAFRPTNNVEAPNCATVKDSASASGYLTACEWVNPFCDCDATFKWPVGSHVWVRGFLTFDAVMNRWVVQFKKQTGAGLACGGMGYWGLR